MDKSTLGARPELRWIDKRNLAVDRTYQRTLEGRRSQALIDKLAANFCWAHCNVLVVVKGLLAR